MVKVSGVWFATDDLIQLFGIVIIKILWGVTIFSGHDIHRKNLILGRHRSPRILIHRRLEEVEFAYRFVRGNCSASIRFNGSVGFHGSRGYCWPLFRLFNSFWGRLRRWRRHLHLWCVRLARLSKEISTFCICLTCQFEFDCKSELLPDELFGDRSLA